MEKGVREEGQGKGSGRAFAFFAAIEGGKEKARGKRGKKGKKKGKRRERGRACLKNCFIFLLLLVATWRRRRERRRKRKKM